MKRIYNGNYFVEKYNENGYILATKNGVLSNYFIMVDGAPVFENGLLYVNNTTKNLIKRAVVALNA